MEVRKVEKHISLTLVFFCFFLVYFLASASNALCNYLENRGIVCVFVSMYLPFSQCISDFLYVLLKQQSWAQPFKSKIGQKFSQFLETRTQ